LVLFTFENREGEFALPKSKKSVYPNVGRRRTSAKGKGSISVFFKRGIRHSGGRGGEVAGGQGEERGKERNKCWLVLKGGKCEERGCGEV